MLFVSLTRLTRTSLLHRKSYSDGTLDLDILGSNMYNGGRLKVQGNSMAVANCERPKCATFEFGKGHCQPNKVNTIKKNTMKEQDLKKDNPLP